MLAAEFFEKTYQSDSYRSTEGSSSSSAASAAAPTRQEPKSAQKGESVRRQNSRKNTESSLRDFAVIVSKAYKQECTSERVHATTGTLEHTANYELRNTNSSPGAEFHSNSRHYDRTTKTSRTTQRSITKRTVAPISAKERRASVARNTPDYHYRHQQFIDSNKKSQLDNPIFHTPSKNASRSSMGQKENDSPLKTSPVGVVGEWETLNMVATKQQQHPDLLSIDVPRREESRGEALDVHQNPFLLRDRCEKEALMNRELRRKVSELQTQVTTLQKPSGGELTTHKINHYHADDSDDDDDDSHEDSPNVVKDISMILEECLVPLSSGGPNDPPRNKKEQDQRIRKYKAQLEESKQVIQMLFRDLKVSKQREALLEEKLHSSSLVLHEERLRSRENTKIAMKSADDVRASLLSKLQHERNEKRKSSRKEKCAVDHIDSAEAERLKRELALAKEECLMWKQKERYAKNSAAAMTPTKMPYQEKKETKKESLIKHRAIMESFETKVKTAAQAGENVPFCGTIASTNQKDERSRNNLRKKDKPEKLRAVERNEGDPKGIEKEIQSNINRMHSNATTTTRTLPPNGNPKLRAEHKPLTTSNQILQTTKQHNERQSSHSKTTRISNDKNMGTCSTPDSDISGLTRRRLDFFSCVANDSETLDSDVGSVGKTMPPKKTRPSSGPRYSPRSQDTLNELMKELKASKERLQTAEEKLNNLVNTEGLMNCTKFVPNCEDPKIEESVDVVNSFDDGIEVSHRRVAYV